MNHKVRLPHRAMKLALWALFAMGCESPEPIMSLDAGTPDSGAAMDGGTFDGGAMDSGLSNEPLAGQWRSGFTVPGALGGTGVALAARGDSLAVGGQLAQVGGVSVRNVALFDNAGWQPLGEGVPGSVQSLAYDGAGGLWAVAFEGDAQKLWRFDGAQWEDRGIVEGEVSALYTDAQGDLVAAGFFSSLGGDAVDNLARYTQGAWTPVHSQTTDGPILAVTEHEGALCIAGLFGTIGGNAAIGCACLSAGSWEPRSLPEPGYLVSALGTSSDGELLIGGNFDVDPSDPFGSIARWTGSEWSPLAVGVRLGLGQGVVTSIATYEGRTYIAGAFNSTLQNNIEVELADVAVLEQGVWTDVDGGLRILRTPTDGSTDVLDALATDRGLIVAGLFDGTQQISSGKFARFDGRRWSPLEEQGRFDGINGFVFDVERLSDTSVVVAGDMYNPATQQGRAATAIWDSSTGWSALPPGPLDSAGQLLVASQSDLARDYGGPGPLIFALGTTDAFETSLAVYNGASWTALSTALEGPPVALSLGADGRIYAATDVRVYRETESSQAAGMEPLADVPTDDLISAMAVLDTVYISTFDSVLALDGAQWRSAGQGLQLGVGAFSPALTVHEGHLYAAGATAPSTVARLEEGQWVAVGPALNTILVSSLSFYQGRPVLTGILNEEANQTLLVLDQDAWRSLNGQPDDLTTGATMLGDSLCIVGVFSSIGEVPSASIGLWSPSN